LPKLKAQATARMQRYLGTELQRLESLRKVNPGVRDSEIAYLQTQLQQGRAHIQRAEFQLQALRLIVNG